MTKIALTLIAAALATVGITEDSKTPVTKADTTKEVSARRHCQVPCGVYGDKMRIDMIREDVATITKAMASVGKLSAETPVNYNQIVRWTMAKDDHAQKIQDTVAQYWLAQRIKAPKDATDQAASAKYQKQLALMHGVTVAAMKCKQTTDAAWGKKIEEHLMTFAGTYFSKEDLEHLKGHHDGHK